MGKIKILIKEGKLPKGIGIRRVRDKTGEQWRALKRSARRRDFLKSGVGFKPRPVFLQKLVRGFPDLKLISSDTYITDPVTKSIRVLKKSTGDIWDLGIRINGKPVSEFRIISVGPGRQGVYGRLRAAANAMRARQAAGVVAKPERKTMKQLLNLVNDPPLTERGWKKLKNLADQIEEKTKKKLDDLNVKKGALDSRASDNKPKSLRASKRIKTNLEKVNRQVRDMEEALKTSKLFKETVESAKSGKRTLTDILKQLGKRGLKRTFSLLKLGPAGLALVGFELYDSYDEARRSGADWRAVIQAMADQLALPGATAATDVLSVQDRFERAKLAHRNARGRIGQAGYTKEDAEILRRAHKARGGTTLNPADRHKADPRYRPR